MLIAFVYAEIYPRIFMQDLGNHTELWEGLPSSLFLVSGEPHTVKSWSSLAFLHDAVLYKEFE